MEVSGVVYRPLPRVSGGGTDDHSVLSSFNPSRGVGNLRFSGSRGRTTVRNYPQSGFSDEGSLRYYCHRRPEIICGGGAKIDEEVKDEKKKKKLMKKRSKLLKALSKNVDFGLDNRHALLDQIKGNMMSDATEVLISQLRQQLKAEEKELKRKRKEAKAMKKAQLMQKNRLHCEGASSTSSSSSSESSDSECGEVVDMSRLKNQALAPPVAANELLQLEKSSPVVVDQQPLEKKIEVCMGGKCKKSGAETLIEEFNKVLGGGSSVVGCKCMGKCRSAPNVRVMNSSSSSSEAQTAAKSLCIGVGLDDVSTIVANLLGQDGGGFAAAAAASWSGAM